MVVQMDYIFAITSDNTKCQLINKAKRAFYVNCMFIIALVFSVLSLNNRVAISVRYTFDVKMAI